MSAPEQPQHETTGIEFPFGRPPLATPAEPSPSASETVTWIGRYRVERQLGQGGFGAVYLALDEELNRRVAIKVPKRLSKSQLAEYREEAQKLAKLEHPGVVPIHDIGHTAEFPVFLVTKYIEGGTLSEWVQRARPDFLTVSRLIAEVARAAAALLRLSHSEPVWPMLRRSNDWGDPRRRSELIHAVKPLGVDPRVLAARLLGKNIFGEPGGVSPRTSDESQTVRGLTPTGSPDAVRESDASARRALLLALPSSRLSRIQRVGRSTRTPRRDTASYVVFRM